MARPAPVGRFGYAALDVLGQPLVQPDRVDITVTSGRNVLLNGATGPWQLARLTSEDITADVAFSASN